MSSETPESNSTSTEATEARPKRRRIIRYVLLGIGVFLVAGTAGAAYWFQSRYEFAERMEVPIDEFSKFKYAEDPGARSVHCGQYQGRRLTLVQRDDVHFDFVFEPLHDHIAKIVLRNVDVSLMTPDVPEWTRDDPGLARIALTDREWNRQQVQFDVPSKYVEVSGGNGFEREHLKVVSLAKNCLNAGLWEVILKIDGEEGPASYYHGWFTFPLGQYKRLVELNTGFSYWDHWYKLEHWSDPAGTVVNLDRLRTVRSEHDVLAVFDRDEQIVIGGEQVRKKRTTNATNLVTWGDILGKRDVTFATFRPPGYYDVDQPWENEYWRLAIFEGAVVRRIDTPTAEPLDEIELIFRDEQGNANRFIVGGIDLAELPQLPTTEYPDGLYMPMGIGVPPFFQSI